MHIVPFKAEHVHGINLQVAQALLEDTLSPTHAKMLETHSEVAYSAIDGDTVIASAGIVEQWKGRGLCWALLAGDIGASRFVRVSRAVRRAVDVAQWRRLEMQVDAEHVAAMRWAELLGFEVESKLRSFLPDGRDAFMYVRIR